MGELMEIGNAVWSAAAECGDHPIDLRWEDVEETLHAEQWCSCSQDTPTDCGDYCDRSGAAVFRTVHGALVVVTEWGDTTGHG